MKRNRAAFTLIELLVVITIIGILAVLVFAIAPSMMLKAHQAQSLNNLRQIAIGFTQYVSDNNGSLPSRPPDGDGQDRWPVLMHSYLQDTKVYAAPDDPKNYIKAHTDPLSNGTNNTSYIMNSGMDWGVSADQMAKKAVVMAGVDQPSKTILLGVTYEHADFFVDVAQGDDTRIIKPDLYGASNDYVFMDGSARTITAKDYKTQDVDSYLWLLNKHATATP